MPQRHRRNPYAFHPLMRKGGAHEKSNGARRQALKQATRKQVAESLAQKFGQRDD